MSYIVNLSEQAWKMPTAWKETSLKHFRSSSDFWMNCLSTPKLVLDIQRL